MFRTTLSVTLAFVTLTIILASCSNNYVATNLDKENFNEYFSPAKVKIYETEQSISTQYQLIGVVEGQDCQKKPHHAAPDKINARTQARQQAFDKNANAVVFTGCVELTPEQLAHLGDSNDAQQCYAIIICYAKAFAVAADIETK